MRPDEKIATIWELIQSVNGEQVVFRSEKVEVGGEVEILKLECLGIGVADSGI